MAAKRDIAIAYAGYCLGGESTAGHPLDDFHFTEAYPTAEFSTPFLIHATSVSSLNTEELACRAAFRKKSKNLGVTWGERITANDGAASGSSFTSVVGGFASTDVGLPLCIEGKGTFQITAVASANAVTVDGTIASGSNLTWRVGYTQLRVVPTERTNGTFVRVTINKPGDMKDTKLSRFFTFSASYRRDADNTGDAYRQEAKIGCRWDSSRRKTVNFSGTYTAGGGASAYANYISGSPAFYTGWLSTLSVTAYDKIDELIPEMDDESSLLNFSATFKEIIDPGQSLGGIDSPSIVDDTIEFVRVATYSHGKGAGYMAPVRAKLSYNCSVDKEVTLPSALKALYTGTIKPFLLNKAASLLGGTPIIESESFGFGTSANNIRSEMMVLLAGIGNDLLEYSEQTSFHCDERWTALKVWDGKEDTYNRHSPGHHISASRTVKQTAFGSAGGASMPVARGPTSRSSAATDDLMTAPPAEFNPNPQGKWVRMDGTVDQTPEYLGYDADAQGQVREKWMTGRTFQYLWCADVGTPQKPGRVESGLGGNTGRNPVWTMVR